MMLLFDTNILIDHLKGKTEATQILQGSIQTEHILGCSVITKVELLSGMRPEESPQLELFLSVFEQIDVTRKIADIAGMYMNQYRKSHGINIADAIIGATAKHTGSRLYTLNLKHYPMKEIDIVKPY